jgi:hypothetical protein
LLAACACFAQPPPATQPLSDETLRLARLRLAAASLFDKLPNFTCTLTTERARRLPSRRKFEIIDNLRLEVGYIDGRELYAWPGSKRFDDRELADIVSNEGAIGTGDFAMHAKSILLSTKTKLKFLGEETLDGRRADRWSFHYPMETSQYMVRMEPLEGMVGYSGSLWADSINRDLLRVEMVINEIPSRLPLKVGYKSITYQRVRIGETSFLLPKDSDLTMVHTDGSEARNRTSFSSCHQFAGESTVTFEDPPTEIAAKAPTVVWTLPEGLMVQLKPAADIDFRNAAVGDQIRFAVTKDAISAKRIWLPAGAAVDGRITALECSDSPVLHCVALIRLESFSFDNKEGTIFAGLFSPTVDQQLALAATARRGLFRRTPPTYLSPAPGLGSILCTGGGWPKSSATVWRTLKEPGGK